MHIMNFSPSATGEMMSMISMLGSGEGKGEVGQSNSTFLELVNFFIDKEDALDSKDVNEAVLQLAAGELLGEVSVEQLQELMGEEGPKEILGLNIGELEKLVEQNEVISKPLLAKTSSRSKESKVTSKEEKQLPSIEPSKDTKVSYKTGDTKEQPQIEASSQMVSKDAANKTSLGRSSVDLKLNTESLEEIGREHNLKGAQDSNANDLKTSKEVEHGMNQERPAQSVALTKQPTFETKADFVAAKSEDITKELKAQILTKDNSSLKQDIEEEKSEVITKSRPLQKADIGLNRVQTTKVSEPLTGQLQARENVDSDNNDIKVENEYTTTKTEKKVLVNNDNKVKTEIKLKEGNKKTKAIERQAKATETVKRIIEGNKIELTDSKARVKEINSQDGRREVTTTHKINGHKLKEKLQKQVQHRLEITTKTSNRLQAGGYSDNTSTKAKGLKRDAIVGESQEISPKEGKQVEKRNVFEFAKVDVKPSSNEFKGDKLSKANKLKAENSQSHEAWVSNTNHQTQEIKGNTLFAKTEAVEVDMAEFEGFLEDTIISSKVDKRNQRLAIKLNPKELGEVEVNIIREGIKVRAEIIVEKQDTFNLLSEQSETLKQALSDKGITLNDLNLSFAQQNSQQQPNAFMMGDDDYFSSEVNQGEQSEELIRDKEWQGAPRNANGRLDLLM